MSTARILGDYQVEGMLGEGGMAIVFRARHLQTQQRVALKVLEPAHRADHPGLIDRLRREASVLTALAAIPSVVNLIDQFREPDDGADVLVLEYIEGRSLYALLDGPPIEVLQLLEWMGHVCHALNDMHVAGFVHRDLKPDNLMLVDDPTLPIRIIDFNSAGPTRTQRGNLTQMQGTFPFTPAYLAPECFDGVAADETADVYAIGMTFAELLLGHHPLDPRGQQLTRTAWQRLHEEQLFPDLRRDRPEIPVSLQQILTDCTAKRRQDRIPDAVELWSRLKSVWDELQQPTPAPVAQPQTSRRWVRGVVLVVALSLVLGGAGYAWTLIQANAEAARVEAARVESERQQQELEAAAAQRALEEAKRQEAERIRQEAERIAREEMQAEQQARADELGVPVIKAEISDPITLDKLLHSSRFAETWIQQYARPAAVRLDVIDDVYFLEATHRARGESATLKGVITKVDATGITLQGSMRVQITWSKFRVTRPIHLKLGNHPWRFGWYTERNGSSHQVNLLVDEDWLEQHPEHARK